jgi:hypothetical protein
MARVGQRLGALASGVGLVAAAVVLSSCGGGGDDRKVDPDLPYTFTFPEGFGPSTESNVQQAAGDFGQVTTVARGSGREVISVQTQTLRQPVSRRLRPAFRRELVQLARASGKVRSVRAVTVDGVRGYALTMGLKEAGATVGARWTYFPAGRTLYWISCQWQRERAAVLDGCDEVLRTFERR